MPGKLRACRDPPASQDPLVELAYLCSILPPERPLALWAHRPVGFSLQGLAQCFRKAGGSLTPVTVIEPLSASSLECLANGQSAP